MTYLIEINKKSIRKNKDAGSTVTHLPGPTKITFEAEFMPASFIDDKNCYIQESTIIEGKLTRVSGTILDPALVNTKNVSFTWTQNPHIIQHQPIPEYSYKYKNVRIKCCHCKKSIYSADLDFDVFYYGASEYLLDNICPICHQADCCDLEYESIENALKK